VHTAVAQGFLQGCAVGKIFGYKGWRLAEQNRRRECSGHSARKEIGRNEENMEAGKWRRASSF